MALFEEGVQLVKKRKVLQGMEDNNYVVRLKRMVAMVNQMCTVYMVLDPKNKNPYGYMANHCPGLNFYSFLLWKQNVQYTSHLHGPVCMVCNIPQIDNTLHKRISFGKKAITKCPYPDCILPLIYTIYHNTMIREAAQVYFKVCWSSKVEYAGWLCAPPPPKQSAEQLQ